MGLRYDEKGKFYTEFISKTEIPVIIQTINNIIRGYVYVRKGERLSDELNSTGYFIPVADVTIFDSNGEEKYKSEFITVHRDHIIWLMPVNEGKESQEDKSGGDS